MARPSLNIKSVGGEGWKSQRTKIKTLKGLAQVKAGTKTIAATLSDSENGTMSDTDVPGELGIIETWETTAITPQRVWDLVFLFYRTIDNNRTNSIENWNAPSCPAFPEPK